MVGLLSLAVLGSLATPASAVLIKIDNVSPMIIYDPPLIGEYVPDGYWKANAAPNAWNTTFTQGEEWEAWDLRKITENHYTWVKVEEGSASPTAKVSFVGTSIVLFSPDPKPGEAVGEGVATLRVDDKDTDCRMSSASTLQQCAVTNLPFGRHELVLTVKSGGFAIGHFEVETGVEEGKSVVVDCVDGNKKIKQGGDYNLTAFNWGSENETKNSAQDVVFNWTRAVAENPSSPLSVTIPEGYSRVEIWGAVDVDHNRFLVELEPPAYDMAKYDGSAYNLYTIQNISMFDTMLDSKKKHTIKITNLDEHAFLDVSQFKLYEAQAAEGSSGLSSGAIAGIVVGAVAALGIVGALVWFFFLRRKKQAPRDPVDMESDGGDMNHTVEPYTDAPPADDMRRASIAMSYAPAASSTGMSAGMAGRGAYPIAPSASHQSSSSTSEPLLAMSPYSNFSPLTVHNPDEERYVMSTASTVGIAALDAKVPARPVTYHHMQHTDGGVAAPQAGPSTSEVVVTEAPPVYNPDWAGSSSSGPSTSAQSEARNGRSEKGSTAGLRS